MSNRKHSPRRRGSSLIETAMLLPVVVLLGLGGLDFSRVYVTGAQLEAAAAAAAAEAARRPEEPEAARALALENLPSDAEPQVSIEIVCACPGVPSTWIACEQTRCEAADRRRYARAVASATFHTVGRYPGVPARSRLKRERFVRSE